MSGHTSGWVVDQWCPGSFRTLYPCQSLPKAWHRQSHAKKVMNNLKAVYSTQVSTICNDNRCAVNHKRVDSVTGNGRQLNCEKKMKKCEVAFLPCRIGFQCRLSDPPVNERTNNSVQACDPQSGLLVTRSSTREAGMGNGTACGTSEEKSGSLLRDRASTAAFIAPGTCTHDSRTHSKKRNISVGASGGEI